MELGNRAETTFSAKFWRAGWLVTFFFIPFGSSLPGLLVLLPSAIFFPRRRDKRLECATGAAALPDWTNRLFMLFLLAASVSGLLSSRPAVALGLLFGFSIMLFVFFYGAQRLAGDFEAFVGGQCLPAMIIGSVVAYLISLIRYYIDIRIVHSYGRAVDLFCGCNGFATVIIMVYSLSLGYFIWRGGKLKYLALPYLILAIIMILATKSRGGWLGFSVMLSWFAFFNRKLLSVVIITIIILIFIFSINPLLKDRFISIFTLENNLSRINIWQATIEMIKEHPLVGVGAGIFPFVYKKYVMPDFVMLDAAHAHNLFLQVAAEFGLPGLVLFSSVLVGILGMSLSLARSGNGLYQGLFAALMGVLVHQQFDLPIWGMDIGGAFWILAGLVAGLYRLEKLRGGLEKVDHPGFGGRRERPIECQE